ncbi:LppX_LprAFG lipoprotein [Kitasatospora sp. NPDC093806]|uniref:LppX_LprAFG lipoprotein n=1 Tax=Kitasatospora sp. NPDC093806 TaxID=3155075 RepID=UPI003443022A
MRRATVLVATATVVALTALTGCNDDTDKSTAATSAAPTSTSAAPTSAAPTSAAPTSATPTSAAPTSAAPSAAGDFDPAQALATKRAPGAATMTILTEAAGRKVLTTTGRVNVDTVFTGRMEVRTADDMPEAQAVRMETVVTADGYYYRDLAKPGSGWTKAPRSEDNQQADYAGYAKLLLATGPAARVGMEQQDGVPTYHLKGHLGIDDVAAIDPSTQRRMKAKGVTGFDCDQWIDKQGRTIRFEQRMDMRGIPGLNTATFKDFGPVESFPAPVEGTANAA